jgi:hypothetical protein
MLQMEGKGDTVSAYMKDTQPGSFKLTAFPVFFLDKNRIPVRVRAIGFI